MWKLSLPRPPDATSSPLLPIIVSLPSPPSKNIVAGAAFQAVVTGAAADIQHDGGIGLARAVDGVVAAETVDLDTLDIGGVDGDVAEIAEELEAAVRRGW